MMNKANADQFAAYKAMMIAQAVIATSMAIVGILAAESKLGMFAIPLAFTAGAIGIAQIALIAAQEMPARALGGSVSSGQSYLVGERGPEIFTPGATGQITSNDKLGALGGQSVNVTHVWQVSTGVADTVRAEISRLLPMFDARSVASVRSAMRGGEFA
jgi:SLT domain-containing protein